jgi:hypothetical protein
MNRSRFQKYKFMKTNSEWLREINKRWLQNDVWYSFATNARCFAKTRRMSFKRWKDNYCKIFIQHTSERRSHQMNQRRNFEMYVAWEIHFLHHKLPDQNEIWLQIEGLLLTTKINRSTKIKRSTISRLIISFITEFSSSTNHFTSISQFTPGKSTWKTVRWTAR